jgi:hypothetical protein
LIDGPRWIVSAVFAGVSASAGASIITIARMMR